MQPSTASVPVRFLRPRGSIYASGCCIRGIKVPIRQSAEFASLDAYVRLIPSALAISVIVDPATSARADQPNHPAELVGNVLSSEGLECVTPANRHELANFAKFLT